MLKDLRNFVFILMVFVLSYGIICQSIKYQNISDTERTVGEEHSGGYQVKSQVFFKPYWQLYGEMTFLEEDTEKCCPLPENDAGMANFTECMDKKSLPRCPRIPKRMDLVYGFYMLIGNILLLNLLIALFASTYDRVSENRMKHWKIIRTESLIEYKDKMTAPIPFNLCAVIFYALIRRGKKIWVGSAMGIFRTDLSGSEGEANDIVTLERIAAEDVERTMELSEGNQNDNEKVMIMKERDQAKSEAREFREKYEQESKMRQELVMSMNKKRVIN